MITTTYRCKVRLLKNRHINLLWRYWQMLWDRPVGNYARLPGFIEQHAPGRSFVDIGCMWGVNGDHAFLAEEVGASEVKAVDVFGPTPEFDEKKEQRRSNVQFILGDITNPDTIERIGPTDVVFCAGVLYHHPSPFDVIVGLRRICQQILILRTSTIPEIKHLPNAAVYFPMLSAKDRRLWNLKNLGLANQVGITHEFDPEQGYGNWFWGLTPSCLSAMLETAGFRVDYRETEAFAQTFVCTPVEIPFEHRLPGEFEAREIAREISAARVAQPA
jgi:hypothetical protein